MHSLLARVLTRTLEKYERAMEALDAIPRDEIEEEMLEALLAIQEPNPAMVSAIAKFLKDNDIGLDSDEVEELNSTQRRLEERRKARAASGLNLSIVPHVEAS
jgi:hypothetical protein